MAETLDKHGNRAALGLEDRVLDVAEVLAVDLQRQRPVAGDLDPVEVVPVEQRRAERAWPRPVTRWRSRRGSVDGAHPLRRDQVEAELEAGLRARRGSGSSPRRCTGRRSRRARRRRGRGPPTSSTGSKRSRRSATRPQRRRRRRRRRPGACRRPAGRGASTRRTSSASRPMPAEKPKRRPFTRPTEIVRVRPASSASPTCRAAAAGSRGRPSARESTFAPPPGRKPSGIAGAARRSAPR